MNKFKLLLLLPLVVCTGYPQKVTLTPYLDRLSALSLDLLHFIIYTVVSLNYDAYFFAPALISVADNELFEDNFLDFFAEDFRLKHHAKDFNFSETETREQFAKRFFHYIAHAENVPSKTREKAAKLARQFQMRPFDYGAIGFIRPCPLYSFARAITLLEQMREFRDVDKNSIEVIIKFLLTEFSPLDYNIEDKTEVADIPVILGFSLSFYQKPLVLSDGSLAFQCNQELFERLVTEEFVPQHVKDAIINILPHM